MNRENFPVITGSWSQYGPGELNADFESALVAALATGQNFCTGWGDSKKEIVTFCIVRVGDTCQVSVTQGMDDAADLADTAVWEAAGKNDVTPDGFTWLENHGYDPESEIDEIIETCLDGQGEFSETATVTCAPVLDEIKKALDQAADKTDQVLEKTFGALVARVKARYSEMEP